MPTFQIESWAAIAPGLTTHDEWNAWFESPGPIATDFEKVSLSTVPPMLRRRFGQLGQYAMAAIFDVMKDLAPMPCVFASRHGDTKLTLSLLESMASDEPLSPTGFSLAVHNAVSGLYSIAVKNNYAISAISAQQGLMTHALLEAVTQLTPSERVLCVIYDMPLPELYASYTTQVPFPYAIALILSQDSGDRFALSCHDATLEAVEQSKWPTEMQFEALNLIDMLLQRSQSVTQCFHGSSWCLERLST